MRTNLLKLCPGSFVALLLWGGCSHTKESQLEKAAKDWCLTIRASQVIPIYPLSEDIQPGDVFLVQVPVQQQQEIYLQKGFLALDNHIGRLNPSGYAAFYGNSFFSTNEFTLPRDWIRPEGVGIYSGTNGSKTKSWASAPRAAFPSYGFAVNSGQGLNLAVPVQGVPVGLSLLASDAATGSIQIQDARTMGVDTLSLYRHLKQWAATNADFLMHFASSAAEQKTNFLRVVTRIYATGRMVVSLKDASNRSAGLDVGVPKPVNLLQPQLPTGSTNNPEAALRNYTNAWSALSEMVRAAGTAKDAAGNVLPGGSLRLASASSSAISLDEIFDPPLVLGYLGFDCSLHKGGLLGPPIPTHAILDPTYNRNITNLLHASPVYGRMLTLAIYGLIADEKADPKAQQIRTRLDALDAYVPDTFTAYNPTVSSPTNFLLTAQETARTNLAQGFRAYLQYHTALLHSTDALRSALQAAHLSFKQSPAAEAQPVPSNAPLRQELQRKLNAYENVLQLHSEDARIQEAVSDAFGFCFSKLTQ